MVWVRTRTACCSYDLSSIDEVIIFQAQWDNISPLEFETGQTLRVSSAKANHDEFFISIEVRRCAAETSRGGLVRIDERGNNGFPGDCLTVLFEIEGDRFNALLEMIKANHLPQYITLELDAIFERSPSAADKIERGVPLYINSDTLYWKNKTVSDKHDVDQLRFMYNIYDDINHTSPPEIYTSRTREYYSRLMNESEKARWYREQTFDLRQIRIWMKRLVISVICLAVIVFIQSFF